LWERSNQNKAANEPSSLQLVSSDTTGHIIVWDVVVGNPRAVLQEGNKPILGKNKETIQTCLVVILLIIQLGISLK
jgi:hypothetical protein